MAAPILIVIRALLRRPVLTTTPSLTRLADSAKHSRSNKRSRERNLCWPRRFSRTVNQSKPRQFKTNHLNYVEVGAVVVYVSAQAPQ